jgi:cytoskeletal protein CcmA (bactofilin family)
MRESMQGAGDPAMNAMLGPSSVVEGKLSFEGPLRIDGTFTGEINTPDRLIIGEAAKVSATISCGSVVVSGELSGNVRATESIELRDRARVKADLATPSLVIDKGVVFDGGCHMLNGAAAEPATAMFRQERRKAWQNRTKTAEQRGREPEQTAT